MNRWLLPGPASFVNGIVEALRDGSNVAIAAPMNAIPDLSTTLEYRLGDEGFRLTRPFTPGNGLPIDELYSELELRTAQPTARTVASLLSNLSDKRILFVESVSVENWRTWKTFLEDYASASRSVGVFDRSQILLIARGIPRAEFIGRAPALEPYVWNGQISEADVLSYILQFRRSNGRSIDLRAKLIARIICRIGSWDLDLVDKLLHLDWRELFDPMSALTSIAATDEVQPPSGASWELGGTSEIDGEQVQHALAVWQSGDPSSELRMRLWAAQAAELLPLLELKRRKLAERVKATRRIPPAAHLNGEIVQDLHDVELGGLLHLARVFKLPTEILRNVETLRDLRNKLAHLTPISAEEAADLLS